MINLQWGGGGGSLGDQFVKCVYFFQLYFFIFYDIYLFSSGTYWINVCTCSVPPSFELVLKVNMKMVIQIRYCMCTF